MCRVLFAVGHTRKMEPLVDAFVKASENDPYKAARGKGSSHSDGWGYVLLDRKGATYYRSPEPVFRDEEGMSILSKSLIRENFAVLMLHSRAASQGTKDLFNVQPFAFSSRRGFSYWIYHNGDLDKDRIIEMAEFEKGPLNESSDSYVMAAYLCRRLESLEKEELLKHYSLLAKTARTSFNTGSLFIGPGGRVVGFVTAYSEPTYLLKRENWDYVRQNFLQDEEILAIGSSTLELYHDAEWEPITNGTAFYIGVDFASAEFSVERLIL